MRPTISKTVIVALVSVLFPLTQPGTAQKGPVNREWRHYGGDAGGTKYSPLDQSVGI
jgi:hypothetical protein